MGTQRIVTSRGTGLLARIELRRAWRTMIVLGVLAGFGAGVALAAVQLARRSSTAYARLERATGTPDAIVLGFQNYDPAEIAHLPQVRDAWMVETAIGQVEGDAVIFLGMFGGLSEPPPGLFTPLVVDGRIPDPDATDELMLTDNLADLSGLRVGDKVPLSFLTANEVAQFDTGFGEPDGPKIRMRVVGIVRAALGQGANGPEAFSTPAFARQVVASGSSIPSVFVRLRDGEKGIPAFRNAVNRLVDTIEPVPGAEEFAGFEVQIPSMDRPVVAVTARVIVTGLLVFGAIAGLAALIGVALALRRHNLLTSASNARTLTAIGVTRRQMLWSHWLATTPFMVVGVLTCTVVALATAGIGPIGTLSEREPFPGWHPNLALLGVGVVMVAIAFALVGILVSARLSVRRTSAIAGTSRLANRLASAGAPVPVAIGTGFALEPSRGRSGVPVRSAIAVTAIGLAGVVGVIVYAASLHRVVDNPARWGWTADAQAVDLTNEILADLRADPGVDGVAPYDEFQVRVEGRTATGRVYTGPVDVTWTVLDGRRPRGAGEVMLGARLARTLGRGVGDRVVLTDTDDNPVTLAVVGVGTGPDLSDGQFGGGVVLTDTDAARVQRTQPSRGAMVSYGSGTNTDALTRRFGSTIELGTPDRPPDVDNLAQLGRLPELLIAFLAVLLTAVLAHSVVITTRRRRRELDTLRAVGVRRGQVRGVIVVAALVTVGIGLGVGVVFGIIAGRLGWGFTADAAYVADDLRLPVMALVALAIAVFIMAALIALLPAWRLTREPIARGLRDE